MVVAGRERERQEVRQRGRRGEGKGVRGILKYIQDVDTLSIILKDVEM